MCATAVGALHWDAWTLDLMMLFKIKNNFVLKKKKKVKRFSDEGKCLKTLFFFKLKNDKIQYVNIVNIAHCVKKISSQT